ncbi:MULTISPECIES: DUF4145 domain-containing protein [Pseudomonas]|jgi:hypothetical protein|uniref:DUF4145 domain-containing protein n=2 Tax=Pseudomonas putida TaxID=303 RepID=A0A140FW37_PSEPK|nr:MULTISPECIES: DUF4145 domain-containing protein [Pseudomonas]AMM02820.1 conserved protein of unknown function [Pseudomonas putida KT2440]KAF0251370.1 hypothetical protein GN299_29145 [Pseudomonas putida]KMU96623.1 hypothetical protein AC138_07765 [Pseudomonas putida]KMY35916.1 hypothetical protein AA993_09875 [Pseudomonas putida]MDD2080768.1 DUF4145 domain-containing protein [Pseudomonas putida]
MEIALGIVNAVSWPVCILWLAYLFRPEIRAVFTRVSSLKFKEFEASFSEELSKTEETLAKLEDSIGPTLPKAPSTPPELRQLERIAEVSPRAAIIEAWRLIELAAGQSGFVQGATIPRINVAMFINSLIREGKIPVDSEATFEKLRELRNQAAHSSDFFITPSDAHRYLRLAARACQLISEPI